MDTEKPIYENPSEEREPINEPKPITYYEPQSKLEKWVVGIACATFFPLVYLIGSAVRYLLE